MCCPEDFNETAQEEIGEEYLCKDILMSFAAYFRERKKQEEEMAKLKKERYEELCKLIEDLDRNPDMITYWQVDADSAAAKYVEEHYGNDNSDYIKVSAIKDGLIKAYKAGRMEAAANLAVEGVDTGMLFDEVVRGTGLPPEYVIAIYARLSDTSIENLASTVLGYARGFVKDRTIHELMEEVKQDEWPSD